AAGGGGSAAGLGELLARELSCTLRAPVAEELGEPIAHVRREPERLTDLARRAPASIRDDVGGHPRAEPSVAAVDVLDHRFAPLAARQIEGDVGPLAPRLAPEPPEHELPAHRIHPRDPPRLADPAVRPRAAPPGH